MSPSNQSNLQLASNEARVNQSSAQGVEQSPVREGDQSTRGSAQALSNQSSQGSAQALGNGGDNQRNPVGAQVAGNAGVQRATPIESFEKKLTTAQMWARIIGSLHALSRFLAFCNLTWATVVLLGAFVSDLLPLDFAFIVCLVLLEGARLASAAFCMRLLMRPLAYRSQDPKKINHGEDGHYPRSRRARISSYLVQSALIIPSLVLPTIGQVFLDYGPKVCNLQDSLRMFYSFVASNSLIAILNMICSACAFSSLYKPPEQSILRYFDAVLEKATSCGLVQADDFEFFHFAYTMLGGEFRRNVQPEAVAKNHRELIEYLYAHRLGVDFLEIYMDSKDAFVQLAAVNMVGFWADSAWGVGLGAEVKLPGQLLTKLADKVGMGQVGWAANTCIGVLASMPKWAHKLAHTRNSNGGRLLDCLADIIDDSSSRSLSIVRTLVRLYEQLCEDEQQPPRPFTDHAETNLMTKLRNLASKARVQRLRVQAAYLLLMMGESCEASIISAIKPTLDTYWFKSEAGMLELLLQEIAHAPDFEYPADFSIREDPIIRPPPWARASSSSSA